MCVFFRTLVSHFLLHLVGKHKCLHAKKGTIRETFFRTENIKIKMPIQAANKHLSIHLLPHGPRLSIFRQKIGGLL